MTAFTGDALAQADERVDGNRYERAHEPASLPRRAAAAAGLFLQEIDERRLIEHR